MKSPPQTFHVKSFGCQMNVYDGERMAELMAADGMVATDDAGAADLVVLADLYLAREDPDPTVDARTITDHADAARVRPLEAREEVAAEVAAAARPGDLVLMLGAGDIVEDTPAVLDSLRRAREQG